MPIYSLPPKDEVFELINTANKMNPGWVTVTPTNVKLGVPSAATVAGNTMMNTAIRLSAANTDFIGSQVVNYRRRDLNVLFRGVLAMMERYSPNQSPLVLKTAVVFSVYDLLPLINSKYGLNLTVDDVADVKITRGDTLEDGFYTTTVVVTAKPTSLAYIGQFALKWKGAAQDISQMISITDLPGRLFPGGNLFDAAHRPILTTAFYGFDFTDVYQATPWGNRLGDVRGGTMTLTFLNACIARVNQQLGTTFPLMKSYDYYNPWGCQDVPLPSTLFPEANSKYYNRLFTFELVTPADIAQYGPGRVYLHYNV